MVDLAQFNEVRMLVAELKDIGTVLENLENGGRIVAMSVAPPASPRPEGEPPHEPAGVTISTSNIDYPPAMLTGIQAALTQRRDAIEQELTALGVSGVEQAR